MKTLNRSAFVIRPKEAYLHWAASLDKDARSQADNLRTLASVYLVPEHPTLEEETPPLKEYVDEIFKRELAAWSEDEECWPESRDLLTFLEWFQVHGQSVVTDLGVGELTVEEM